MKAGEKSEMKGNNILRTIRFRFNFDNFSSALDSGLS